MRDFLAKHRVIDICMRIDMDQRDRPVPCLDRPQDRPGQGMIPAQCQRDRPMRQHAVVIVRNNIDGLFQIKGVDRHIADIGHLQMIKRCRPGRHVIGPQHPRFVSYLARPHPGTRPVRRTVIHRNANERHIQPCRGWLRRQAHHRGRPTKARHVIATQRLIELAHVRLPHCIQTTIAQSQTADHKRKRHPKGCQFRLILQTGSEIQITQPKR